MSFSIKISFFLLLFLPKTVLSCLAASQERIIPIGTHENCLIAIEIIGQRYSEGDFFEKELWHYEYSLKGFNADYSSYIMQELGIEKRVEGMQFEHILTSKINKAIQICKALDQFEILKPKSLSFCDFQRDCNLISLKENKGELQCHLTETDVSYPIAFFGKDYQGSGAAFYKEHYNLYYEEELIGFDLKLSSIRNYENSKMKLIVFQLGRGQEFKSAVTDDYPIREEYNWNRKFSSIKNFIFEEPVLHHGDGFDYFVTFH